MQFERRNVSASVMRVVVVEDYEPFRRFLSSTLRKNSELQVVAEIADGLEAVRKAEELQPDLIMMDLGLPTLNGIEAARQIRKVAPKSRILFVSQESSAEIVEEALSVGLAGYIVKAYAGSELLPAVEAVRQGKRFISAGLRGLAFTSDAEVQGRGSLPDEEAVPTLASGNGENARKHEVQFYRDDSSFLIGFSRFIETALMAGKAVIVLATKSHHNCILERLKAQRFNIDAAIGERRYLALDLVDMLSTFMVNGMPDRGRFTKVADDLVMEARKAAKGEPPCVVACGECAPFLWAQGQADAAIQVEHLWDEIARKHAVDTLCGYVLTRFQRERGKHISDRISAEHSAVRDESGHLMGSFNPV
ncbi:MAG TPA: response regulator [Terriglobales bacterium]|nr:response regulator [Terriglobales bacterium]